jgi:hypothetical protein
MDAAVESARPAEFSTAEDGANPKAVTVVLNRVHDTHKRAKARTKSIDTSRSICILAVETWDRPSPPCRWPPFR